MVGTTQTRSSFSQRGMQIEARRLERWNQPEENSGDDGRDKREQQHAVVNSDFLSSRQEDDRQYGERCPSSPKGGQAPNNATCQRQHHTFGQELPGDAA